MNFSKLERFLRFSGLFLIFRPILLAGFDRTGNFTLEMYFWIFFWSIWSLVHQKSNKQAKNKSKNRENLKNAQSL